MNNLLNEIILGYVIIAANDLEEEKVLIKEEEEFYWRSVYKSSYDLINPYVFNSYDDAEKMFNKINQTASKENMNPLVREGASGFERRGARLKVQIVPLVFGDFISDRGFFF